MIEHLHNGCGEVSALYAALANWPLVRHALRGFAVRLRLFFARKR